jgi:hypothetical protein
MPGEHKRLGLELASKAEIRQRLNFRPAPVLDLISEAAPKYLAACISQVPAAETAAYRTPGTSPGLFNN